MRCLILSAAACALLSVVAYAGESAASPPVASDAAPDGTVTLSGGSIAAGIGYTWAHGELTYRNDPHPFAIHGVSIVEVGATSYSASGTVYNLKALGDFAGDYVAAGAGITIAGGGTAVFLKNEHGVVIKLIATDVGLQFKLSADGVRVTLKD